MTPDVGRLKRLILSVRNGHVRVDESHFGMGLQGLDHPIETIGPVAIVGVGQGDIFPLRHLIPE